jgi:oligopeptide/dipeptide ABC transporter ATP-binding protein
MSAPFLEVKQLSTWYPIRRGVLARTVGHVQAVTQVSLTLGEGETLGLVGESGCGKSTLGRTLVGLEQPRTGEIWFRGQRLPTRGRTSEQCRAIQMIFQDPAAALNPRLTVLDQLTEGVEHHGLLKGSREEAALQLLADVGMDASALHRYPFEFSGGQRQRINIARALSLRPAVLVCDEAVSALDVSVQAQVLNLLMDLKEKYRLSYLFISHDLSVVRFISDRIAVMYLGRMVEEGPAEQVMDYPRHPYTEALVSAVPVPGQSRAPRHVLSGELPSPAHPPAGCPFHPRCPKVMPVCRAQWPSESREGLHRVHCHLRPSGVS